VSAARKMFLDSENKQILELISEPPSRLGWIARLWHKLFSPQSDLDFEKWQRLEFKEFKTKRNEKYFMGGE